ncbi:MAG: hypothetical protein R3D63_12400 [Paracoccaceae bacterium]
MTDGRLARERRGRLAAERLLEQKTRELFAANEKLACTLCLCPTRSLNNARWCIPPAPRPRAGDQNSRFLHDLDRAHTAAVMAERRLWDSINTIRDGFAVFDTNLKLVTANHVGLPFRARVSHRAPAMPI